MLFLLRGTLALHLTCAFAATITFWLAALATKGGRWHRTAGARFAQLMYAAATTGILMGVVGLVAPGYFASVDRPVQAIRSQMVLVLYLSIAIVAPMQHGLAAVAAGPLPLHVRSRLHAALSVALIAGAVICFPLSVAWHAAGLAAVCPAGFAIGLRDMLYASRRIATPADWQREHLTGMLTSGIALHTAFFVLLSGRWSAALPGAWQLAPWVLPVAIGMPAMLYLRGKAGRWTRT